MQASRAQMPDGHHFFTIETHQQQPWLASPDVVKVLGDVMRSVRADRPFETLAMVIMPDHLHCIWRLPANDPDFSYRWMRIKQGMAHRLANSIGHQALWRPRMASHALFDEDEIELHTHYIHFNPVKHGLVQHAADWPFSTFHRYVKEGVYDADWRIDVDRLPSVAE